MLGLGVLTGNGQRQHDVRVLSDACLADGPLSDRIGRVFQSDTLSNVDDDNLLLLPTLTLPFTNNNMTGEIKQIVQDLEIDFVSLGMFIIDQIDFKAPTPSVYNVIGGAGTYSAIGARIMSPGSRSKRVGWIVDAGKDFPPGLRQLVASWNTGCLIRETPERLTTRGWNGYGDNEHRG